MPSVEDELRRLAAQVRLWISRRKMRVKDIEANLGWKSGHMSKILGGHSKMKVEDFFRILAAIDVDPAEFFHDLPNVQISAGFSGDEGDDHGVDGEERGTFNRSRVMTELNEATLFLEAVKEAAEDWVEGKRAESAEGEKR